MTPDSGYRIERQEGPALLVENADRHAAVVNVDRVTAHTGAGGWQVLSKTPVTVDLLKLQNGSFASLGLTQLPATVSTPVLLSILVLGVVCTALAFLIFFALIAEAGPVRATVITYVNPAVALALGVIVLHEALTLGAAVGFALILAGSVLSTQRARQPRPAPVIAEEYQPEIGHG